MSIWQHPVLPVRRGFKASRPSVATFLLFVGGPFKFDYQQKHWWQSFLSNRNVRVPPSVQTCWTLSSLKPSLLLVSLRVDSQSFDQQNQRDKPHMFPRIWEDHFELWFKNMILPPTGNISFFQATEANGRNSVFCDGEPHRISPLGARHGQDEFVSTLKHERRGANCHATAGFCACTVCLGVLGSVFFCPFLWFERNRRTPP